MIFRSSLTQWWCLSIAEEHEDNLFGDINMVNGVPWPVMSVKAKYHRFRVRAVAMAATMDCAAGSLRLRTGCCRCVGGVQ